MIGPREYCREVSAFLDPNAVLGVLARFDDDREAALAPSGVFLNSGNLKSGKDGGLDELLRLYCHNFVIPEALLHLCRVWGGASEQSVAWLRSVRFEGSVEADPDAPPSPEGGRKIILIRERDALADLLMQPALMLLDLVDRFASTWKTMKELPGGAPRLYLLHSSNGPFAVFVETIVAKSFGFENVSDCGRIDGMSPKINYRSTTLAGGPLPPDPRLLAVAQESSRHGVV